jgi:WD40 repeat protein
VKERELRKRLLTDSVPEELEARERVWPTVRAAWETRERVSWAERRARPILALAAAAVLVGAAVSPPGRVAAGWLREQVAVEDEQGRPLVRLPAPGRLLVLSPQGPWVVQADGSRRLLGAYEDASWSPNGKFVAVAGGRRLAAVEPDGSPRWSLSRPQQVSQPRWFPRTGFRVAYRSGNNLRVVVGDGTRDRLLARDVGPAAPAWRPGERHVIAYATGAIDNEIVLVDVDSGRELRRIRPQGRVRELAWSPTGRRLVVAVDGGGIGLYFGDGRFVRMLHGDESREVAALSVAPDSRSVAFTDLDPGTGRSRVVVAPFRGASRVVTTVAGRLSEVAWSPNGRWLVAAWPRADQWLFLRVSEEGPRIVAVSNVSREFDPGATGPGDFPRVAGWCC